MFGLPIVSSAIPFHFFHSLFSVCFLRTFCHFSLITILSFPFIVSCPRLIDIFSESPSFSQPKLMPFLQHAQIFHVICTSLPVPQSISSTQKKEEEKKRLQGVPMDFMLNNLVVSGYQCDEAVFKPPHQTVYQSNSRRGQVSNCQ